MTHLVKERFLICKTCEHSRSAGFDCVLRTGCCFGKWRTKSDSKCPAGKWPEFHSRITRTNTETELGLHERMKFDPVPHATEFSDV